MEYTNKRYNILNYKRGCKHYNKNCKIYAECCKNWYNCRICHNEKHFDHILDRKNIKKMKCISCQIIQPINNICQHCYTVMGTYNCKICNLFDNDGIIKRTFHCKKCNICRTGGRENFIHCNLCKHCIEKDIYDDHICLTNNIDVNCPICLYTLNNKEPLQILVCGHVLHVTCYKKYYNNIVYKSKKRKKTSICLCPICRYNLNNNTNINTNTNNNDNIEIIDLTNDDTEMDIQYQISSSSTEDNIRIIPFTIRRVNNRPRLNFNIFENNYDSPSQNNNTEDNDDDYIV